MSWHLGISPSSPLWSNPHQSCIFKILILSSDKAVQLYHKITLSTSNEESNDTLNEESNDTSKII